MIKAYTKKNYKKMLRQPEGQLKHPYLVPGSVYANRLWDWDCWLTNVALFEKDLSACGELHEYYDPESGEPVINPGFQNWNLLSLNMDAWLNHEKVVEEF